MTSAFSDGPGTRILKVRLPTETHLRLHRLKILKGQTFAETVATALDDYLTQAGFALPPPGSLV